MRVTEADVPIASWARKLGYTYYYCQEAGLPERCLKVHLGQVVACFCDGALVRLTFQVDGELINDAFSQLHQLLAVCEDQGAYLEQQPAREGSAPMPSSFSQN